MLRAVPRFVRIRPAARSRSASAGDARSIPAAMASVRFAISGSSCATRLPSGFCLLLTELATGGTRAALELIDQRGIGEVFADSFDEHVMHYLPWKVYSVRARGSATMNMRSALCYEARSSPNTRHMPVAQRTGTWAGGRHRKLAYAAHLELALRLHAVFVRAAPSHKLADQTRRARPWMEYVHVSHRTEVPAACEQALMMKAHLALRSPGPGTSHD
jgi:hypothetical protein